MSVQQSSDALAQVAAARKEERRSVAVNILWQPFTWLIALAGIVFAVLPVWGDNVQLRESLLLAAVYVTLASNLNIVLGYAGYVNFGNIVFFGLGRAGLQEFTFHSMCMNRSVGPGKRCGSSISLSLPR
jgi:hypothetical protein